MGCVKIKKLVRSNGLITSVHENKIKFVSLTNKYGEPVIVDNEKDNITTIRRVNTGVSDRCNGDSGTFEWLLVGRWITNLQDFIGSSVLDAIAIYHKSVKHLQYVAGDTSLKIYNSNGDLLESLSITGSTVTVNGVDYDIDNVGSLTDLDLYYYTPDEGGNIYFEYVPLTQV